MPLDDALINGHWKYALYDYGLPSELLLRRTRYIYWFSISALVKGIKYSATYFTFFISTANIDAYPRVPTKNRDERNIIESLQSKNKIDVVLEKSRRKRKSCSDIDLGRGGPTIINGLLYQPLKGTAVVPKRQFSWNYARVRNGKSFARKADNTLAQFIVHQRDIGKISQVRVNFRFRKPRQIGIFQETCPRFSFFH